MDKEKLSNLRHTLAHVLAQAVLEKYPNAQLTLGPAVDNGFYYDIDFGADKITEDDLKKGLDLVQKQIDASTKKVDEIDDKKQKEILEV